MSLMTIVNKHCTYFALLRKSSEKQQTQVKKRHWCMGFASLHNLSSAISHERTRKRSSFVDAATLLYHDEDARHEKSWCTFTRTRSFSALMTERNQVVQTLAKERM